MQTLAQTQKMDQLKQEVHKLREEVTTLRAEVEKLTNLVSSLTVQRNPQPLCMQPPQQQCQPLCIQLPRHQAPQQFNPQKHAPRTKFDPIPIKYAELLPTLLERNWVQIKAPPPIPIKYAELLPTLLERNWVQIKAPPPIPKKLPARFRTDHSFVFHQGAPGPDVEGCYALKNAVQDLVEANILSFKDFEPGHAS